jgi:LysM repeat protein
MRVRFLFALVVVAVGSAPASANAAFVHVVAAGESLTSIAATDGLSVAQVAAANGLSPTAALIAGSPLVIPPQNATATSMAAAPPAVGSAPSSANAAFVHIVAPGESLTSVAAADGLTVAQLAAANGLSPTARLISGSRLVIPAQNATATPTSVSLASAGTGDGDGDGDGDDVGILGIRSVANAATSQPVGAAAEGVPTAPPYPTAERLTAAQIGQIAAANGVAPSLAEAIAWQESGFNNSLVSVADARGVMQVLPGTWQWIQQNLNGGNPLAPSSAVDNVRAGALLLRSLLASTGGNTAQAVAGYFQGLPSVNQVGVLPETRQYVNNVLALQRQFGG